MPKPLKLCTLNMCSLFCQSCLKKYNEKKYYNILAIANMLISKQIVSDYRMVELLTRTLFFSSFSEFSKLSKMSRLYYLNQKSYFCRKRVRYTKKSGENSLYLWTLRLVGEKKSKTRHFSNDKKRASILSEVKIDQRGPWFYMLHKNKNI